MSKYGIISDKTGLKVVAELAKQTALLGTIANTSVHAALVHDWPEMQSAIQEGTGQLVMPVGTRFYQAFADSHGAGDPVPYDAPWDVCHHGFGALADGEVLRVMYAQMHYCLPFSTQFSPYQAFLYSIDGLPAGTYSVSMGYSWSKVVSGKRYVFTLTQDLPAGGQLSGFETCADANPETWKVKAWASRTSTSPTETVSVAEGDGGTSLGTFTAAGVPAPADGTPSTQASVEIDGVTYRYYGLNSLQRVGYGNNRWLHSPLRQWLNSDLASGWYEPKTVYDRPPSYVAYPGFLTMLPDDFVEAMRPVAQRTALNYVTDGGTAAVPEFDTTYDKVFLPSWGQHWLMPSQIYGSTDAEGEGEAWEYWQRVAGTSQPLAASTGGHEETYHREYVQRGLEAGHPARYVFMRSAYRGRGVNVAYVTSAGTCSFTNACNGLYAAPACAIG